MKTVSKRLQIGILLIFLSAVLASFILPALPEIRKNWNAWEEEHSYQKLVKELRKMRDEARARGEDWFERGDFFRCKACRTYEDVFMGSEKRYTVLASNEITDKEFTVLHHNEKCWSLKNGGTKCRSVYKIRCGVCGLEQKAVFSAEFDF